MLLSQAFGCMLCRILDSLRSSKTQEYLFVFVEILYLILHGLDGSGGVDLVLCNEDVVGYIPNA